MKLKYDQLLSNFAFNCNLRHYAMGENLVAALQQLNVPEVWRCRLTPG